MAATLHDVARRAGVSFKTVSNVINDYPHVRDATRKKVIDAIRELDYRPNIAARQLRSGRSGVIGVAVPELGLPYFAELTAEVIEAADGEEALELAETHAGEIDLLISDVIMPGLDGPTLLKKARPHLGSVPVMFISGYAEAEFSDLLEGETGVTFLPKPIDIKVLAEKVKQQLSA